MTNCDHLNLLKSGLINMALIHVSLPHVILFLLLFDFIYFGVSFLRDVSTIHTFPSTVLSPKQPPWGIVNIISLCRSSTEIWSIWFCFFTRVTLVLTNNEFETLGGCITWVFFSVQSCNLLTNFSEKILA